MNTRKCPRWINWILCRFPPGATLQACILQEKCAPLPLDASLPADAPTVEQLALLHRYEQVVAAAGVPLAFLDCEYRVLLANPAYAAIYASTPAELRHRPIAEIVGAALYQTITPHLDRACAGATQRFIIEAGFPDGQQHTLDAEYCPAVEQGQIQGIVISLRDITALKATETSLRISTAALQEAQRLARIGTWRWDLRSGDHTWSEEIYLTYGRDPALPPAVYPEVAQYFTPESWANLAAAVEKGIAAGEPYECDAEVVRPDGGRRWVTARGEALRDDHGEIAVLHGTVQDITERKLAELNLARRNQELERFNRASVGRELDMLRLKQQVNMLMRELGREPPFDLSFLPPQGAGGTRDGS